ncbi:MAG: serine/threonine protein kinase [Planctomycetes bacterium]|nr:serine/threonine protein kinase [Planctomycetota bacterium]
MPEPDQAHPDPPSPVPFGRSLAERTVADGSLQAGVPSLDRTAVDGSSSGVVVPAPTEVPVIGKAGLGTLVDPDAGPMVRYAIGELLGSGATSHVYAASDRNFGREVAIKFLEAGLARDNRRLVRFVREACITARLDHPNIVPVYDLDQTDSGGVYLTMRRVSGISLGDALRRAARGDVPSELGDFNRRVNIVLKICDALACAHDRGIVHQDVKPDNIMLGRFGEVVLVDWGAARVRAEEPAQARVTGTPAYMSPEQARAEPADQASDIYGLGATWFHMLALRLPAWAENEEEFWRKKRAGVVDELTAEERARVPRRLHAIALKALAADAPQRYRAINEFAADLQAYQAGLAISAYRETLRERLMRWHRQHARSFWLTSAALAALITSALWVYGERLKEVASWGSPTFRSEFEDDLWKSRMKPAGTGTGWERRDGRLVSTGKLGSFLFFDRPVHGPVAIEVEGEMLPGSRPCDLSAVWTPDDPFIEPNIWKTLSRGYMLQVGAFDNSQVHIFSGTDQRGLNYPVSTHRMRLETGRRYRLRFEVDHDLIAIEIDGRRVCEYRAPFPCASGWIGLYAFYPGKAFDHLALYTKDVPERVSATAIGDSWYQHDRFAEAAEQYGAAAEAHAGSELGDEALYKQGLSELRLGHQDSAEALWKHLANGNYAQLAEIHRIEWIDGAGDIVKATSRFAELLHQAPAMRSRLALLGGRMLMIAGQRGRREQVLAWLTVIDRLAMAHDPAIETPVAESCITLGHYQRVIDEYPLLESQVCAALMALGRADQVISRHPEAQRQIPLALIQLGRLDEVVRDHQLNMKAVMFTLNAQGRYDEAAAYLSERGETGNDVLIRSGRADQVLTREKQYSLVWISARLHTGRIDEALAAYAAGQLEPAYAMLPSLHAGRLDEALSSVFSADAARLAQIHLALAIQACQRGDLVAAAAASRAVKAVPLNRSLDVSWWVRSIGLAFLDHRGDPGACVDQLRAVVASGPGWLGGRPWHAARLVLGEEDEAAFLAQPFSAQAPAALLVCRGLRAELAGKAEDARSDYHAYLALPLWRRCWDQIEGDPVADAFVAWRLAEIEQQP